MSTKPVNINAYYSTWIKVVSKRRVYNGYTEIDFSAPGNDTKDFKVQCILISGVLSKKNEARKYISFHLCLTQF